MYKTFPHFKSKTVVYVDANSKDKTKILNILKTLFQQIILSTNSKDIITLHKHNQPDLIIITLSSISSETIRYIKILRQFDYHIPIIVLSDYAENDTLLEIANLSVDAFLYKPLNKELFLKSIYKSIKRNSQEELVTLDKHLVFNISKKELYLNNSVITLGVKEFQLLQLFIKNHSKVITKEEIEKSIWPLDSVSNSTLKKLIHRIRNKLNTDIIVSVRGIGYRLNVNPNTTTQKIFRSS